MVLDFSAYLPISRHWLIRVLSSSLYLDIDRHGNSETEAMSKSPHISNCSVASDYLGKFLILIIFFPLTFSNSYLNS